MMGFDFLLVQPQAFIEKKKPRLRRKDWTRVYLKTPNAPGQRAFLRCAASFFLEIRQYSCEKMSCATQKSLAAGHIMSFQIHPKKWGFTMSRENTPEFGKLAAGTTEGPAACDSQTASPFGGLILCCSKFCLTFGDASRARRPGFLQSPISRSMTYISSFSKFCSLTQAAWNS